MKKLFSIALLSAACLLTACSTGSYAYYDDIYTTSQNQQYKAPAVQKSTATSTNQAGDIVIQPDSIIYEYDENGTLLATKTYYPGISEPLVEYAETDAVQSTPSTGNTYITNNYYDEDDYYDYYYTSRIRRFHRDLYCGWGYYDPFYTNLYWYDYNPYNWVLSIYMGYNWWWPSYAYRPYYYGYGWYDYGFTYGWGWAYHHPHHYWDYGYHGWHHNDWMAANYYHNNFDHNNTFYYGHRNNVGPSLGNHNTGRGDRPRDYDHPTNYGNSDNSNHYSVVTSSPASFNREYSALSAHYAPTGTSSGSGAGNLTSGRPNSGKSDIPAPATLERQERVNGATQPASNTARQNPTASSSTARTPNSTTESSKPTSTPTVTRVVTRPSSTANPNARPSTSGGSNTPSSYSRPASSPSSSPSRSNATYSRPNSPSSSPRPNTSSSSTSRPSSSSYSRPSSPSSSPNRSGYSGSSSSSRSSYSGSSSSNRSGYSGSSSSGRSSYSGSTHSSSSGGSSHSGSSSSGGNGGRR